MKNKIRSIYRKLYSQFGPQHWWPGETALEVAVGAILTQNTNWGNVERAIGNIKSAKALSARTLHELPAEKLAELIRPAGYFNIKAGRLKNFIDLLSGAYGLSSGNSSLQ
jgi:endonuclease-3 related protein